MVGIVVVSHSKNLAQDIIEFVSEMKAGNWPLLNGSGTKNGQHFGSDPMIIKSAIEKAYSDDGVLIFCDIGSSIINTQIAIEFLDLKYDRDKVVIADAPIVEGTLVGVTSNILIPNVMQNILDELEKLKTTKKV